MQQNFGLGDEEPNFAWSFDGVPEENSLNLMFGDILVEIPAMDLVLYRPRQLLGEKFMPGLDRNFLSVSICWIPWEAEIFPCRFILLQNIFRILLG